MTDSSAIDDSYEGNVIISNNNISLDKTLSVQAKEGVETSGNVVINNGSLDITSEGVVEGSVVVKDGSLTNNGTITENVTLEGGEISGSGTYAD